MKIVISIQEMLFESESLYFNFEIFFFNSMNCYVTSKKLFETKN
jgi:hypothetical protein